MPTRRPRLPRAAKAGPQSDRRTSISPAPKPVRGFPPIADRRARVLVLGSMPGEASLRAGQYYAHPHNAFWRIMGELCGAGPDLPYEARTLRLLRAGIALWDVLQSCARRGSLDGDIDEGSIVPNDFATFFAGHRGIRAVFCNGGKSFASYRKHVLPALPAAAAALPIVRLPSTSAAHASLRLPQKLRRWRVVGEALRAAGRGRAAEPASADGR